MAVVFQFHRINLHPLHLSYITFAVVAIILLPSPKRDSEYNGKHCYDLGTINADAEVVNTWDNLGKIANNKNVSHENKFNSRYAAHHYLKEALMSLFIFVRNIKTISKIYQT